MSRIDDLSESLGGIADSLKNLVDISRDVLGDGIGTGTPQEQIVAALIIGGVIIATTAVGLIGTILLLPIPITMLAFGVLRLWSPFNERWPL